MKKVTFFYFLKKKKKLDLLQYIDNEAKRLENLTTFEPIYEEYLLEHLLIMIINYKNSFWLEF